MALKDVLIWLGRFDSVDEFCAYIEEHYITDEEEEDEDDRPISKFAAGQGETFIDHDFLGTDFIDEPDVGPMNAVTAERILSGLSYSNSFLGAVVADAVRTGLVGANAVISLDASEISSPRSINGDGFKLLFLGTYQRMPPAPDYAPAAVKLDLRDQRLAKVPFKVFEMTNLVELDCCDNSLTVIPDEIEQLQNLVEIYLYGNQLTCLPGGLFMLPKLRKIMAQDNALQSIPSSVGAATSLVSLTVSRNAIIYLPAEIGDLSRLEHLDFSSNLISEMPTTVRRLRNLSTLLMEGNPLVRLPDEITQLTISDRLSLPRSIEEQAHSSVVQEWLAERQRKAELRRKWARTQ